MFWRKDGWPEAKEDAPPSDPEAGSIPHLVTENGARRKFMGCAKTHPVDCVYAGETTLAIYPEECIDCGICEPECPAQTIVPGGDPRAPAWVQANGDYTTVWPSMTREEAPRSDTDERQA